ncbi:MAG: universal stress protein, partial [Bacteroidales bacterium]|nr:universal stress protein [Candidatus Scybalocola fimicaballi]
AIHSELKAEMLVHILKANGIDAFTEEVNQLFPSLTASFRVKIAESDLSKALSIVESMDLDEAKRVANAEANNRKVILLPFDYTPTSEKAFPLAFSWAKAIGAEVEMLNVYITEETEGRTILNRMFDYDKEALRERVERAHSEAKQRAEDFQNTIQQRIDSGELADVKFKCIALEGVPEEQIIKYSDVLRPELIIMATREKRKKEADLIGSVSAEVAEGAPIPVFVVPENIEFNSVDMVKDIMFITNFDDRDLVAFSKMMSRLSFKEININLVHFRESGTKETWNEIKLNGIKSYFAEHYPTAKADTAILDGANPLKSIRDYMKEKNTAILSMTTHRGKLISRIFNTGETGVTRRIVFEGNCPTLIFHA